TAAALHDQRPRAAHADGAAVRPELDQGDRKGGAGVRPRPHPVERRQDDPAADPTAHRGAAEGARQGRPQHGGGPQSRRARDPARCDAAPEGARRQGRGRRRRRAPGRGSRPGADRRAHEGDRRAPEAQGSGGDGGLVTSLPGTDVTPEEHLPEVAHAVAIIMDGNGRWAAEHDVSIAEGHRAGSRALRPVVESSIDLGIDSLAVYAFSTENWSRSPAEVAALMEIFGETIDRELE